jgi:TRAP transporter TAXI family solute receptor
VKRVVVALLALALTAACGGQREETSPGSGGRLTIATGNTTGVYYLMGGGLAKIISADLPGYRATAEATKASKENVERVVSGQNDIAFALEDTASDAVRGVHSFTAKQPVRALLRIYDNTTHVIARSDSGIASVADLRGKSVSTGSPGSGTEVIATRLLEANGLGVADISQKKASLPETVDAMKDGSVDAMVWSGGLPTAGVKDLLASMGGRVRFLDLSRELPILQAKYGEAYHAGTITPGAYGTKGAVRTIVVPNVLLVRDDMGDKLAGDLVRLLFDRKGELAKIHPEAENIRLETAAKTGAVPLHPGAAKALADLGATP